MMLACFHDYLEMVEIRLNKDAYMETKTAFGETALMVACYNGH
jgi:ankyrin repeat protein